MIVNEWKGHKISGSLHPPIMLAWLNRFWAHEKGGSDNWTGWALELRKHVRHSYPGANLKDDDTERMVTQWFDGLKEANKR